ncbi:MAG: hypothetical protein HY716_18390 [Planctomycetes bacterium]|nr:hypothetical protein [Planctomycetota bacterium]
MDEAPAFLDTAYEYAGLQAAAALHAALSGLFLPMLLALCGIAWRIFRMADDGDVRPLVLYLLSLAAIWWMCSPSSVKKEEYTDRRAPRALVVMDRAADEFVARAIRGVNEDFLVKPYEWERLALMCRSAQIQESTLRSEVREFLDGCTKNAVRKYGDRPPPAAARNPLADDTGLDYAHTIDEDGRPCEPRRRPLLERVRRETETDPLHLRTVAALADYQKFDAATARALYVDKLVRNVWLAPPPSSSELEHAKADLEGAAGSRQETGYLRKLWELAFDSLAHVRQWFSDGLDARQRRYSIIAHGPHFYGLVLMLLMALFPVAGVYALWPGQWTVLLRFARLFFSVKLWPFGWSLLSAFVRRRPVSLALADALSPAGDAVQGSWSDGPNLFVLTAAMYVLVPAACFLAVHLMSIAAALPVRRYNKF